MRRTLAWICIALVTIAFILLSLVLILKIDVIIPILLFVVAFIMFLMIKRMPTDEQRKQIPGVAKTNAAYELAEGFSTIQSVLHMVSIAIIAVLLVVSLLIISNTVKLAMYDRKDEIAIMKMVGATNGFIRLPFVVEGFTLGMIGAVLAFGLEWLGYDAMIQKISTVDSLQLFHFVPFQELLLPMVVVFGAAGMFVGIVGSWTSIRKFMDV